MFHLVIYYVLVCGCTRRIKGYSSALHIIVCYSIYVEIVPSEAGGCLFHVLYHLSHASNSIASAFVELAGVMA